MAESNLEVTLQLTALFGSAAQDAARNLETIADRIDDLGEKKSVFTGLQQAARALNDDLIAVEDRLGNLNVNLGNVAAKADTTARSVSAARVNINDMGNAAGTASVKVEATATAADNLGNKAAKVRDVGEAVGEVAGISEKAKSAFEGLLGAVNQADRGSLSSLMAATRALEQQARDAGGAFRNLRQEIEDMNRRSVGMTTPSRQTALNPAQPYNFRTVGEPQGGEERPRRPGTDLVAIGSPFTDTSYGYQQSLPRGNPRPMLTDGNRSALVPFAIDADYSELGPEPPVRDAKFRNTRASDYFNSGRTFNADYADLNPAGFNGPSLDQLDAMEAQARRQAAADRYASFNALYKRGDTMQSAGFAGIFNATMLGGWMVPATQGQFGIDRLDATNEVTARAYGASPETVSIINKMAHANTALGGNRADVIAGLSSYMSSMSAHVDINDPQWQKTMRYASDRASKVALISQGTNSPVTNQQAQFGTNQAIANMGFDTSTPQALGRASEAITNMLVKMKNVSPSGIGDTLAFLRNLGPIGALTEQKPEDIAGLIYALAKGKMVGGSAGNAMKRLFQRETLPTPTTERLQDVIKKDTGEDLKLYDDKGKPRSMIDVLGSIADLDKKHHLSGRTRAQVVGQLSGLYAEAPIGQLLDTMEKYGGSAGLKKQGQDIMHKGIAGSKKDSVEAEFAEQSKTAALASQRAANAMGEAWGTVIKDLEPNIVKIAGGIKVLADGFAALPAPVRDGAVVIAAGVVAMTALGGVMGVVEGNTLKFIGGIGKVPGAFGSMIGFVGKVAGAISSFGGVALEVGATATKAFGGMVISATRAAIIEPIMGGARAAMLAFGIATDVSLGPVIGVLGLVAAAALGLWLAWSSNLGNCQGAVVGFEKNVSAALQVVGNAFQRLGGIAAGVAQKIADSLKWIWDGVSSALSKADDLLGGFGKKGIAAAQHLGSEAVKGAKAAGAAVKDHLGQALDATKDKISAVTKDFNSFVQHAETMSFGNGAPTKAAAPLTYGDNGQASPTVPNIAEDSGLGADVQNALHPPKKHKAKKPKIVYDASVNIHDLPESEVEAAARRLEAQWKSKHPTLKPGWVDLKDSSGNLEERVYGFKATFEQAVKNLMPDKGLKEKVDQYLERAKFFRTGTEKEITQLEAFLKQAKTQGLQAYIESQIASLDSKHLAQLNKVKESFTKGHAELYGEHGSAKTPDGGLAQKFSTGSDTFNDTFKKANDEFREMQQSAKDHIPTVEELKNKYNLLRNEVKSLDDEYSANETTFQKTQDLLDSQAKQLATITGNTAEDRAARSALSSEMDKERTTLTGMNSQLTIQKTTLDQVTVSMNRANTEYQKAVEYQKTLAYVFQQAGQAAKQSVDKEAGSLLSTGATNFLSHITQSPGGRSGGAIGQLVQNYLDSYINSASNPIAKMLMPGGETKPQNVVDTAGNKLFETANTTLKKSDDSLTKIAQSADEMKQSLKNIETSTKTNADNTNVFSGMEPNGDGSFPVAGTSMYASNATDAAGFANDAGQFDSSNEAWGDTPAKKNANILQSQTAKTIVGYGGAVASTLSGMSEGGIGGAITSGVGTFASLSEAGVPPQVAIPIAAASSLISGLTHHDDPQAMPDKYNTAEYGQIEANLFGAGYANGANTGTKQQEGANGTYYVEDNATAQATNNLGDIQYIQQWAAANLKNSDASIAKLAQTDAAKYGAYNPNATKATDIISYDKDIANEKVVGGTEAGNYTQIYNDATLAAQAIQQLGSASLQAAQNAKALADSFTANIMGGPSGFSIPYLGSVGAQNLTSSSFIPTAANAILNSGNNGGRQGVQTPGSAPQVTQNVTVRILEGATVGDSTNVTQAVQNALPAITAAVNQANYNQMRYMQTYQSQLS